MCAFECVRPITELRGASTAVLERSVNPYWSIQELCKRISFHVSSFFSETYN